MESLHLETDPNRATGSDFLVFCNPPARGFLFAMMRFLGEHFFFGPAGAFAFLTADFLDLGPLRGHEAVPFLLNLVEQQPARNETIHPLLARFLALHRHAGRLMYEQDAGGNFIHILSAMPAGADKTFLDVRLPHAERNHALRQLVCFIKADGQRAHGFTAGSDTVPLILSKSF